METEFDSFIEEVAVAVIQQQGVQFRSPTDAAEHKKRASQNILQLLQQSSTVLKEGLQILSERCSGFVADVSRKLLAHVDSPGDIARIIATDIKENDQSFQLFSEAANSFYECGDYHVEQCVLTVFLMVFPSFPQPYACFATMIWRKDGIAAAEMLYTQLVNAFENPVLDYFAADCFVKAKNKTKARELIQRALGNTYLAEQEQQDLRQHLQQLLKRCNA